MRVADPRMGWDAQVAIKCYPLFLDQAEINHGFRVMVKIRSSRRVLGIMRQGDLIWRFILRRRVCI